MTSRWRPASIHTRLTVWYSTVLLVILMVIGALSYSLLERALTQDVDRALVDSAEVIREAVAAGHGARGAADAVAHLGMDFDHQVFEIVDANGSPLHRSPNLTATLPISPAALDSARRGTPTFETVHLGGERARLVTLPIVRGQTSPLIQVAVPLTRIDRTLGRYFETLLVLVPLALGLAAAAGALLARKALAPVDDMSRAARAMKAEDLSRRIELRGTGDELDGLAETLNDMLARLESAFAGVSRFSADAAHELRTPLTALKGGLEVALRAERSPAEYRRVVAASLEEVDRLIQLAEDLLMVARSAVATTPRTVIDLEQIALESLDVGARLAQPRGVTVRLGASDQVLVLADPATLRRAAVNLVENAVKYTPSGGLVELQVCRDDHGGLLSVQDTGPGVPPEDRARVFEPFVRLDAARDRESGGAGLGLSIARSIVVAHGGTLTLDSAPGGGACFTIRLPAAA